MEGLVVITGCSGRVGSCLIERLKGQYELIGLDILPPKDQTCQFLATDLCSDESVKKTFESIGTRTISSFVHLAAYYSFSQGAWENYERITLGGMRRILQFLSGRKVEQFLFSSTMLVHPPSENKITEEAPLVPRWAYPRSKILAEKILLESKVPSLILRIAGCYDDFGHSIPLANMIQRIYEKRLTSRFFPGNLNHGVAFLHFSDLAEAVAKAIVRRSQIPSKIPLLLGEEKTYSYEELQRQLWRLLHGKEKKTYRIPKWLAKIGAWLEGKNPFSKETFIQPWMIDFADDHYDLDISRAKKLLDWRPVHSVYESLAQMVAALKRDPDFWYRENHLS